MVESRSIKLSVMVMDFIVTIKLRVTIDIELMSNSNLELRGVASISQLILLQQYGCRIET